MNLIIVNYKIEFKELIFKSIKFFIREDRWRGNGFGGRKI